jgi:hypothetical protein
MAVLKQALNLMLCLAAVAALSSLILAVPSPSSAQPAPAPEYMVKAAFLYNFIKFIEWPEGSLPSDSAVINLCVMEESPLGRAVETMQANTVKGRKIAVNYMKKTFDTSSCQILFIGNSDKRYLQSMLSSVSGKQVLTVGEFEGFARSGGIISFIIVDKRISFRINIDAAKRAGLTISAQLLKLAQIVREK